MAYEKDQKSALLYLYLAMGSIFLYDHGVNLMLYHFYAGQKIVMHQ